MKRIRTEQANPASLPKLWMLPRGKRKPQPTTEFTDVVKTVREDNPGRQSGKTVRVPHPSRVLCERVGILTSVLARRGTLTSNRSIIPSNARQPHQRTMGRTIRDQPSAPGQSPLPHFRHSHNFALSCSRRRGLLLSSPVALRSRSFRARMDSPIRRPRLRTQAARILQRLAIPLRRRPLVVGQDQRQSLMCGPRLLPATACTFSTPCSMLASLGVLLYEKHAAPDRQIFVVACVSRNVPSAGVSDHHCAPARLLSPQGSTPVSPLARRRKPIHRLQH